MLFLFALVATWVVQSAGSPVQVPLHSEASMIRPRKLQGRFLHITDLHPDPFYRVDATLSTACHRRKPKKSKKRSGYLGTPYSDCDSSLQLTNHTLDYLGRDWSKHIDFVIWTGDNARHDSDRQNPRTPKEIYQLNRNVAKKMEDLFTSQGIPVVPTLGNNDVWPHNILTPGPNSITNEFSSIWKSFIPFPSLGVFKRGAYYSVEVIPNALAVISVNTMYFYDSNKAVDGCEYNDPQDAGNLQLDWLEVQLRIFRSRGIKVWLAGHVPPSAKNYFPECYVRYVEMSLRFQDTILGHLFGHMNVDHFSFIQSSDLDFPDADVFDSDVKVSSHEHLDRELLESFADLPQKAKHDNFGVVNISPSVVPTYLPSFRIFSYNISGAALAVAKPGGENPKQRNEKHQRPDQCEKAKYKDSWRCHFTKPWNSDPDAPSRKNVLWTPLGYAQYYLPKLATANKTHIPNFRLEYLTFKASMLHPAANQTAFWYPIPLKRLPSGLRNSSSVDNTSYTPYNMEDLTIASWLQLAQELGDTENKKLRKRFKKYLFMGKGRA